MLTWWRSAPRWGPTACRWGRRRRGTGSASWWAPPELRESVNHRYVDISILSVPNKENVYHMLVQCLFSIRFANQFTECFLCNLAQLDSVINILFNWLPIPYLPWNGTCEARIHSICIFCTYFRIAVQIWNISARIHHSYSVCCWDRWEKEGLVTQQTCLQQFTIEFD